MFVPATGSAEQRKCVACLGDPQAVQVAEVWRSRLKTTYFAHAVETPGEGPYMAPVAQALQRTPSASPRSAQSQPYKPITNRRMMNGRAPGHSIRVLLAEPHAMMRGALAALLSRESDITVVGESGPGGFAGSAQRSRAEVAVIDHNTSGDDGIRAARDIRRHAPTCRTVILASAATPRVLRAALEAGVRGFVLKDADPAALAETVRRVANGEYVIDSALATRAVTDADGPLTERERDVLAAAAEGASVPEIASNLCLAVGTVRNYLSATISKLDARNRVDAIRIAHDAGWI